MIKTIMTLQNAAKCEQASMCIVLCVVEREIQFFKSGFVHVNAGGRIHLGLLDSS